MSPAPSSPEAALAAVRAAIAQERGHPRSAQQLGAEADNASEYLTAVKELHARRLASGERVRAGARQALTAATAFYAFVQSIAVGVLRFAIESKRDGCFFFDAAIWSAVIGGSALAILALVTIAKVDRLGTGGRLTLEDLQCAEYGIEADGSRSFPAGPLHTSEVRRRLAEAFEGPANALSKTAAGRNKWADRARTVTVVVVLATVAELSATLALLATLRGH